MTFWAYLSPLLYLITFYALSFWASLNFESSWEYSCNIQLFWSSCYIVFYLSFDKSSCRSLGLVSLDFIPRLYAGLLYCRGDLFFYFPYDAYLKVSAPIIGSLIILKLSVLKVSIILFYLIYSAIYVENINNELIGYVNL